MMIFDTDIIIWVQRGNEKAATLIEKTNKRYLSLQSYMELLQCAQNKEQHRIIKNFIAENDFQLLPISEKISHRASIYIEELSLSTGIRVGDALIAATAIDHNLILATSNKKHFRKIQELQLKVLTP